MKKIESNLPDCPKRIMELIGSFDAPIGYPDADIWAIKKYLKEIEDKLKRRPTK